MQRYCTRGASFPLHKAKAPLRNPDIFAVSKKNPNNHQEWPRQTKPKKGQFMNFSGGGIPEQKFNVNRACFPKEKHQNSQKWAKFMNFSFRPFFWFRKGSKRCFPNGVFQIPRLGLRQWKTPFRGTENARQHQCFPSFWCLLPLWILTTL